jgi:acyl-CoA reductase-like NAD-dependent aldehyde dehydrogenase
MTTPPIDQDRIAYVFATQRANRATLKRRTATERVARLQQLRDEVARRVDDIDEALHVDLRKPKLGLRNPEVQSVLAEIDDAIARRTPVPAQAASA